MRIKRLLYAIATYFPFCFSVHVMKNRNLNRRNRIRKNRTMQVAGNQLNEFLNINPDLRNLYAYPDWDAAQIIRGAERYSFILRPCSGYNS